MGKAGGKRAAGTTSEKEASEKIGILLARMRL